MGSVFLFSNIAGLISSISQGQEVFQDYSDVFERRGTDNGPGDTATHGAKARRSQACTFLGYRPSSKQAWETKWDSISRGKVLKKNKVKHGKRKMFSCQEYRFKGSKSQSRSGGQMHFIYSCAKWSVIGTSVRDGRKLRPASWTCFRAGHLHPNFSLILEIERIFLQFPWEFGGLQPLL